MFYLKKIKFLEDERGVSVILGAILLLGIIMLTFPIIYHQHVKTNMIENEAGQMGNVKEQFLELQSKVSFMEGPTDSGQIKIPMSAGSVSLFPRQSPAGTITTTTGLSISTNSVDSGTPTNITIKPGAIKFKGRNLFYPDQTYIYQAGHVILKQDDKNLMISPNDNLIRWGNNTNTSSNELKIKYPVPKNNKSISSTSTETITLTWEAQTVTQKIQKQKKQTRLKSNSKPNIPTLGFHT